MRLHVTAIHPFQPQRQLESTVSSATGTPGYCLPRTNEITYRVCRASASPAKWKVSAFLLLSFFVFVFLTFHSTCVLKKGAQRVFVWENAIASREVWKFGKAVVDKRTWKLLFRCFECCRDLVCFNPLNCRQFD